MNIIFQTWNFELDIMKHYGHSSKFKYFEHQYVPRYRGDRLGGDQSHIVRCLEIRVNHGQEQKQAQQIQIKAKQLTISKCLPATWDHHPPMDFTALCHKRLSNAHRMQIGNGVTSHSPMSDSYSYCVNLLLQWTQTCLASLLGARQAILRRPPGTWGRCHSSGRWERCHTSVHRCTVRSLRIWRTNMIYPEFIAIC